MANQTRKTIQIDLSGIEMPEIQLFIQEGTREIPAMAGSTVLPPCVAPCVTPPCVACTNCSGAQHTSNAQ